MFIKRNRRRSGDDTCTSVLLVHGERVAEKRPPGRPPKDAPPPRTRVVHRTVANLSRLPESLVALIEAYCRNEPISVGAAEPVIGKGYGPLGATLAIARELGIADTLGGSRMGRLALFLVLARVCHRGSRLSAVRWAEDHATEELLGLRRFDEDDLYAALDWLEKEQGRIELALARRAMPSTLYLYDVTSSYLEGHKNELARPGYNRDGKRFKKQIVVGLLTDAMGEPVAIRVYAGNTSDPSTVADPIRFLADEIGAKDIVFVGDRGMLKTGPRQTLGAAGFRFLTALTDAQVRAIMKRGGIQMDLFEETPGEVAFEGRRLILRLNPETRDRHRARRNDQIAKVRAKVAARNAAVEAKPRADPAASLRMATRWLDDYRLTSFVSATLEGRAVQLTIDEEKRAEAELLDGCYVLETDAPKQAMPTADAVARYMDLQLVERDFRTMKTGLLEVRPIFVRKAGRTRGHALVTMLALKIVRALARRLAASGLPVDAALDRLAGVRLVTLGDPSLGLWRLPTRFAPPQQAILDLLPPIPAPVLSRAAEPPPR